MSKQIVQEVRDALADGRVEYDELTARGIGEFVGKTTSVIYHHWGSLDAFLFAVAESGFAMLRERLQGELEAHSFEGVAETFVEFGLDSPDLYAVMFEHHYDWDALREMGEFEREQPGMELWSDLVERLKERGSRRPEEDARILFAGLHGLVSLASTGRANIGRLETADREVAYASAKRVVRRILSNGSRHHA